MRNRYSLALFVLGVCLTWAMPKPARAQYRNKLFGLDAGYLFITQPPITDAYNRPLNMGSRGDRLTWGVRLGGEGGFKLHHDHWWFLGRFNLAMMGFPNPSGISLTNVADQTANANLGPQLGLEFMPIIRWYVLTDHFRPYLQLAMSYQHIFGLGAGATTTCPDPSLCSEGGTYGDEFMPHTNMLGFHLAPGAEIIIQKDLGLNFLVDLQRWQPFGGQGNWVITLGTGLVFYG